MPETSRFFGIVIGMFHDEHPPPHFTLGMAFIRTRAHAATNIPQDSTARDAIPRLREDIATTINSMIGGVRVGKYSAGGRRVDVRMRLLAAQRTRPEDLGRLRLRSGSGELVPLTALVREEERPALQAIFRQDRERAIRSGVGSRCVHVAILFFAAMMKAGPIRLRPGAAGRADEHLRAVMPRCSGTGGAQYQ